MGDRDRRIHTLTVSNSSPAYFGNYSCVASNHLGTDRAYIEVHGRPSNLAFLPDQSLPSPYYRQVTWTGYSEFPVSQYTLLYRRVGAVVWDTVLIPGDTTERKAVRETSW